MPSARLFSRPFRVLWTFYFLVFAAGYLLFPLVPFRLRELGATLAESGRFTAAFTLGSGLGGLVTGNLGDRWGPRRVLFLAALGSAAFFAVYAVLPSPWVFLVLAPVHGFIWSGLRTASVNLVGSLLPDEGRAEGLSLFGLASPGGVAVGPALGLWLGPRLGFPTVVLGVGAVFVALFLLLGALPADAPRPRRAPLAWPGPEVWPAALALFFLALSFGPVPPYSAQEARHGAAGWEGAFLTCFALGMVGLRLVLGMTGLGARPLRLLRPMMALTAAGCALLVLLPGATFRHAAAGLVYGAGYGMVHTLLFLSVMESSQPNRRGSGVGALYAAFDGGVALGALLLGLVMQAWGFRTGWAGGVLALVVAWVAVGRVAPRGESDDLRPLSPRF